MYRSVDKRIQQLTTAVPFTMGYALLSREEWEELRELREASRTTCPVRAILLVAPPENDGGLDPKDERLREWIYRELFGLCYEKPKPSSGLSSIFD